MVSPYFPAQPNLRTDSSGARQLQISRFCASVGFINTVRFCFSESHCPPLDLIFKYDNAIDWAVMKPCPSCLFHVGFRPSFSKGASTNATVSPPPHVDHLSWFHGLDIYTPLPFWVEKRRASISLQYLLIYSFGLDHLLQVSYENLLFNIPSVKGFHIPFHLSWNCFLPPSRAWLSSIGPDEDAIPKASMPFPHLGPSCSSWTTDSSGWSPQEPPHPLQGCHLLHPVIPFPDFLQTPPLPSPPVQVRIRISFHSFNLPDLKDGEKWGI